MAKKQKKATKSTAKEKTSTRTKKKGLTPAQVEYFKGLLLQKRREIIGDANEMHDEALKKSRLDASGDLSSMPIHMADIGSDNFERNLR